MLRRTWVLGQESRGSSIGILEEKYHLVLAVFVRPLELSTSGHQEARHAEICKPQLSHLNLHVCCAGGVKSFEASALIY